MPLRPHASSPLPPALRSRYRPGPVLGSGGASTVYRAHDTVLRRDVAIKLYSVRASRPADLLLQEAEAQLVAALHHHALATLYDAGVDVSDPDGPLIFLVMELIPGIDLREQIARGPLSVGQMCWLAFDLCEALDYVHEAGFVHQDIKPSNVLLAERRAATRIRGKLTDFGISTIVGAGEDEDVLTGMAPYLAPEQVEGGAASPQSDVYSLGLVLLEAVTGRLAFPGSREQSALARLERDPVVPEFIPARVARVLRGMTDRRPSERMALYEAAVEFGSIVVDRLVEERRIDPVQLSDEINRLTALHRYEILDTAPEDAFDLVTRITCQLLGTPIAIVTILDADRVWFKSKRGIALAEVDRSTAFCSSTYPGGRDPWTIPDVLLDGRLEGNTLVTGDPHVRSYAAAPLVTHDGHQLGALCVFDVRPRDFTRQDLQNLDDLAGLVMRELELRLASRRAAFSSQD